MSIRDIIETSVGFKGKWENYNMNFIVDPLTYGYMTPIQRVDIESEGVHIQSSPITNTEWWTNFMPTNSCPRFKGKAIEIEDYFNDFCKDGKCEEACGAEDGFVDLSAARLRVLDDAEFIDNLYPRLQLFLNRTAEILEKVNQEEDVGIGLDLNTPFIKLHTRVANDQAAITSHMNSMKKLYTLITNIHGKIDTSVLPPAASFNDEEPTEDSVIAEAKYYAMKEAVRLESVDILNFLVNKKGGKVEGNKYVLPNEDMYYELLSDKIVANRSNLYMGNVGFDKGVQQLQQFFQTTLGGGRW